MARHLEQRIIDESAAQSSNQGSPWDQFEANILSTLQVCAQTDIQRIVFRDAPTVVGPFEWKQIEIEYGFGQLQKAVKKLAAADIIEAPNPDLTAQIILGAMMEAAHFAATAKNKSRAVKQGQATLRAMLQAIRK